MQSVAVVTFRFFYYVVNQGTVYQQIELCGLFSVLAGDFSSNIGQ